MTRTVRIYSPDKNAMQSGKAKMGKWVLRYEPETPYFIEGLMGWNGMSDMTRELRLSFPSKDAAIAYAIKHKLEYEVFEPHKRSTLKKSYADNFKFSKVK